jgi:hypothetical protein
MEPDMINSKLTGETVWNQMAQASGLQTELDQPIKSMYIKTAWKLWIQRVEYERMIREQQSLQQKKE